jgi:hypothetical protein
MKPRFAVGAGNAPVHLYRCERRRVRNGRLRPGSDRLGATALSVARSRNTRLLGAVVHADGLVPVSQAVGANNADPVNTVPKVVDGLSDRL